MEDCYSVLGVEPSASTDEIKAAYTREMLRLHPDKQRGKEATQQFHAAQKAYEVLRDAALRQQHDRDLALTRQRSTMAFQDELALEELDTREGEGGIAYLYPCRCGDEYELLDMEIARAGPDVQDTAVPCRSCSNYILVQLKTPGPWA